MRIFLQGLFIVLFSWSCNAQTEKDKTGYEMKIGSGWEYKASKEHNWKTASIPGCIHTDLLNNGVIEDPFYRLNEKGQQWIGETDWEYRVKFNVQNNILKQDNINLNFEGLDTYADVYLNDSLILKANNMFRTWELPVKELLKQSGNEMRIYFHNVFKINKPKWDNAPFRLQAFSNNDQAEVKLNLYSRKAGYHYGWDWGPRLITAGVWRPVTIKSWSNFKIENVYYRQLKVEKELAKLRAEINVKSDVDEQVTLRIMNDRKTLAEKSVKLFKGNNKIDLQFDITNPKLWWTNGLGEQPLYNFKALLSNKVGEVDSKSQTIGIRSLEIVRDADSKGKSLYVKLNGVPVFMKGANYIPQDNFQNRVTPQHYSYIVQSAVNANMNMLRVWGGGIYEEDIFYELCDKNGLLVWQDIMFACGMYPADEEFLANVRHEVIDNVTRLRNHPSVALYCGNNENEISWYEWGWKQKYDAPTQLRYEADLKKLFYATIPEAIKSVDPDRYYHPTSPVTGYENIPMTEGDSHYWGVWHGKEPFTNFAKNVSRFNSEYGFQSYPEFESIKKFSIPEDWSLESDVMHAHQRCMADDGKDVDYGNRLINTYLEDNFRKPKNFENYIYVVQALQAKGVKMAVEVHRRQRADNYCMGSLYWQINDCWPVASWSSIDYYGKWKALHYLVKKAYEPLLISYDESEKNIAVHIVSDKLQKIRNVILETKLLDFKGTILWEASQKIEIAANTSKAYFSSSLDQVLGKNKKSQVYMQSKIKSGAEILSENTHFFVNEKELELNKPKIDVQFIKKSNGFEIKLTSDKFAKYVMISVPGKEFKLSDNYFDMNPGEVKVVNLTTSEIIENIASELKIVTLVDSYNE